MKTKTALLMLCLALSLSACKVLKTHIVKVTSSTEAQPHEVLLKTTKGYVYLSTQNMTDKQKHILKICALFSVWKLKHLNSLLCKTEQYDFLTLKFAL